MLRPRHRRFIPHFYITQSPTSIPPPNPRVTHFPTPKKVPADNRFLYNFINFKTSDHLSALHPKQSTHIIVIYITYLCMHLTLEEPHFQNYLEGPEGVIITPKHFI